MSNYFDAVYIKMLARNRRIETLYTFIRAFNLLLQLRRKSFYVYYTPGTEFATDFRVIKNRDNETDFTGA